MPSKDHFNQREVDEAITDLKACIDDAKRGGTFKDLEQHLPRLAYLLTKNEILNEMLNGLPPADIQTISGTDYIYDEDKIFPVDPKARLSKQLKILVAIGEGKLSLWNFSERFFGHGRGGKFWEEIFFPATRDLLRFCVSQRQDFNERNKLNKNGLKEKPVPMKNYTLDLFISHSSKDRQLAKNLIEFLRAALAIPHERVRCTSVDGYKLSGGAKTEMQLRKEIQGARCFIGLITPDSLKSQFVLFELGARWGLDEHLVPILSEGMKASELRPPLSNLNAMNSGSKNEMEQLVHELSAVLKKRVPLPTIYEAQLSTLLNLDKDESVVVAKDGPARFKVIKGARPPIKFKKASGSSPA